MIAYYFQNIGKALIKLKSYQNSNLLVKKQIINIFMQSNTTKIRLTNYLLFAMQKLSKYPSRPKDLLELDSNTLGKPKFQ